MLGLAVIALAAGSAFVLRQRRARNPLYDLDVAARRDLLGRRGRGDHRVRIADGRDVHRPAVPAERARLLHRWTPGIAILPGRGDDGAHRAPLRAPGRNATASRFTLLTGYVFVLLGFLAMLLLWKEGTLLLAGRSRLRPGRGIGVGFAGTPASTSLTGSVPVTPRWAWPRGRQTSSATSAEPLCSRSSALCSPRATPAPRTRPSAARPRPARSPTARQSELTKSFASAESVAQQYPQ